MSKCVCQISCHHVEIIWGMCFQNLSICKKIFFPLRFHSYHFCRPSASWWTFTWWSSWVQTLGSDLAFGWHWVGLLRFSLSELWLFLVSHTVIRETHPSLFLEIKAFSSFFLSQFLELLHAYFSTCFQILFFYSVLPVKPWRFYFLQLNGWENWSPPKVKGSSL